MTTQPISGWLWFTCCTPAISQAGRGDTSAMLTFRSKYSQVKVCLLRFLRHFGTSSSA